MGAGNTPWLDGMGEPGQARGEERKILPLSRSPTQPALRLASRWPVQHAIGDGLLVGKSVTAVSHLAVTHDLQQKGRLRALASSLGGVPDDGDLYNFGYGKLIVVEVVNDRRVSSGFLKRNALHGFKCGFGWHGPLDRFGP